MNSASALASLLASCTGRTFLRRYGASVRQRVITGVVTRRVAGLVAEAVAEAVAEITGGRFVPGAATWS